MNKVILMGRLTRDVEMKYTQGAKPTAIAKFSIAVNRKFKRDGEPDADFLNCTAFGKTAEFVNNYFGKGKMIAVVGSIRTNPWTDTSGQKRISTEVQVDEVDFCGGKDSASIESVSVVSDDDNLPF